MTVVKVISHPEKFRSGSKPQIYGTRLLRQLQIYVVIVLRKGCLITGGKITVVVARYRVLIAGGEFGEVAEGVYVADLRY